MSVSTPSRTCSCTKGSSSHTALELQTALLMAITVLTQLVSQLATQFAGNTDSQAAEPWMEETRSTGNSAHRATAVSSLWDELSVVELRSLLRSYPIDRSSLPAPIELLRRNELIEALNQIQALGA
jgi:ABC-type anion transport system duplicated permease subunit